MIVPLTIALSYEALLFVPHLVKHNERASVRVIPATEDPDHLRVVLGPSLHAATRHPEAHLPCNCIHTADDRVPNFAVFAAAFEF